MVVQSSFMETAVQPFSSQLARILSAFSMLPFSRSRSSQQSRYAPLLYLLLVMVKFAIAASPELLPKHSTGCSPISLSMTLTLFILRFLMMNSPPVMTLSS